MYHDIPVVLNFQRMVSPTVLNTTHSTHDIPHVYHDIPMVLSIPHSTQDNPTVLMISPMVLNTPLSPMVLNTPRYSRYPHIYHDILTVLNIPQGTQDIPHGTHDTPHCTEHPHGTAHRLYRVSTYECLEVRRSVHTTGDEYIRVDTSPRN